MTHIKKIYDKNDYNLDISSWGWDEIKKTKSPYSLYFYLKRGFLYNDALSELKKFQNNKKPAIIPCQLQYWLNKGYSEVDAIIKLQQWQSKDKSSIEKRELVDRRKQTEIENIKNKYNITTEQAYEVYKEKRMVVSPRHMQYWLDKGYSEIDATNKISELQKKCSPRTLEYWTERGQTEEQAKISVSSYQDNCSISAICKRYKCNETAAIDIQNLMFGQYKSVQPMKLDDIVQAYFIAYSVRVRALTKREYRLYNEDIDPNKLRGNDYNLDHKFSIYDGFHNAIPENIIAHKNNLQIISATENRSKHRTSSITLEELYEITK